MPKNKYDWPALKQEFFDSDIDEVKAFFEHRGSSYNRNTLKRTKGWAKEKQEMKKKALANATEKSIKRMTKELEIPMEQLTLAKKNAVIMVINKMKEMTEEKNSNLGDLERIIKILRTEMGLPITYTKNENLNTDTIEGIHIVWTGGPNNKN